MKNLAASFRRPKSGGGQSFSRSTGVSLRLNEQRGGRYRIPSTSNDINVTASNAPEASPSTSTTSGTVNVWTRIGSGKPVVDSNNLKTLKSGDSARLLLSTNKTGNFLIKRITETFDFN